MVMKTQVMVDLYWKCYAYGDELNPHIEFLDGIMLSSTRDIAPSCIENVEELIERQEKSLSQLDTKKSIVFDLIAKGKQLMEKVDKIDEFVTSLDNFDKTLKMVDSWMMGADKQLNDIKNNSDTMTPEDRVSCTMELQEDVAEKVEIVNAAIKSELDLLPQGDAVPKDAQDFKDELKRISDYVTDLNKRVMTECEHFSEDVKYWAEFKTGIRGFKPWLEASEKRAGGGLSKPQTLDEANAMYAQVSEFDQNALKHLKILKKAETLVKEWKLLDNTVNELNSWVAQDRGAEQE